MENITEGKNPIKINSLQNYRNEYLFSEIYLRDITQRPITDENLRASLKTIKEWREYADKTSLEKWTNTYIKPVLDILGFGHHREKEGIFNILLLFPDFDKNNPMSICYVVPPGEDINCTIKGKHWAEKIIRNLRKHNFEWGILTDGIYWRIYHTKELTPYETYVEVNLESILTNQDYPAFQIFYFFFRPNNFIKNENGECKFDIYKEESVKTTEYIEENLRAAIEREEEGGGVLQTLCLGYLDALRKEIYSEEERQCIYGGAILYLFRLLFLFYSTSRDLLKGENIEVFKSIVLDSFRFHNESGAKSNSYDLWLRLQDIFAEIDLTYDGGLFNPHESNLTQFIEEIRITDPFISEVVFGLAYYQKSKGNFVPIEYQDLSVRHLGSLYEGLLEHKLFIAEDDTVVRKSGAKVSFIPQSQAGRITRSETIIKKGKVYFSEDSKERKLTGSYYTPEDVVEYIVKNTVDALLAEKRKKLLSEIEPILNDLESAINESERKRLELFIDDKIFKFIEEKILFLSVLDPTMGSGHFLVNTTNHIANFIVDVLNEFPGYNPKINSSLAYWRRRVVEKCIYGVDLNLLAVELAKLCLWIITAFKEKPLSFLNHHLKQGNALVGVSISDIQEHFEKQSDLFMQSYIISIKQVAQSYREGLSRLTEAIEDIEEKKETLAELDKDLFPYKHLCNFFTHYLLGELKETDLLLQIENWKKPDKTEKLSAPLNSKGFFHWALEFPDVFYGENPGFDCVIGNPPYVEKGQLKYIPIVKETNHCGSTYAFVLEKSIDIVSRDGHYAFIVPLSAISTDRMFALQNIILKKSQSILIANFAWRPGKIFSEVNIPVSIISGIVKSNLVREAKIFTTEYKKWSTNERNILFKNILYVESADHLIKGSIPKIGYEIERNILKKLFSKESKLSNYFIKKENYNFIILKTAGGLYFKICTTFEPLYEKNGKVVRSSTESKIFLSTELPKYIAASILNSSLFYWFYILYSDCYHLTSRELSSFPLDMGAMSSNIKDNLMNLGKKLIEDFRKNSKIIERNYLNRGKVILQQFYARKSKPIIDEIDKVLGKYYGFSNDEIMHIINYDIKYRMMEEDE